MLVPPPPEKKNIVAPRLLSGVDFLSNEIDNDNDDDNDNDEDNYDNYYNDGNDNNNQINSKDYKKKNKKNLVLKKRIYLDFFEFSLCVLLSSNLQIFSGLQFVKILCLLVE